MNGNSRCQWKKWSLNSAKKKTHTLKCEIFGLEHHHCVVRFIAAPTVDYGN